MSFLTWKKLHNLNFSGHWRLAKWADLWVVKSDGVRATVSGNRVASLDPGARRINVTAAALAVDAGVHDGKHILMNSAVLQTHTLPDATGSGVVIRFVVGQVNTNSYVIQVTGASNIMQGSITMGGDVAGAANHWSTAADSDTVTLNGTDSGGVAIGDYVELEDVLDNTWAVSGQVSGSGTEVTPFSAAVS